MKKIVDLSPDEAKEYFLKGSSYYNGDLPEYISFEPIINAVRDVLGDNCYNSHGKSPSDYDGVNYQFVANKDGRFAWRPFELMHPAIYVSLINKICDNNNWMTVTERLEETSNGVVECCSIPVIYNEGQSDNADQVRNWWKRIEQKSLRYSLEYSHLLHSDITDCYGAIYTHSISWALHEKEKAKKCRKDRYLIGNQIDNHLKASRYGQTNGICQGSTLMDFIAEIVLSYADSLVTKSLGDSDKFKILRYRDDYRIFSNNDECAERILKVISDKLRSLGMKLGPAKTKLTTNVIEGSIKPDKLASIELQDLGESNAKTIQKKLLRLHSFGRRYPNSGSLRRLTAELHEKIISEKIPPDDLDVQIAIATDIGFVSPRSFPAIAGILSHLISKCEGDKKKQMWDLVINKMKKIPNNGYLEIWLQRIIMPESENVFYDSDEAICKIVKGESVSLWNNEWITNKKLKDALDTSTMIVKSPNEVSKIMQPEEIQLFKKDLWYY